jgi:hypothetical protein
MYIMEKVIIIKMEKASALKGFSPNPQIALLSHNKNRLRPREFLCSAYLQL